LLCRNQQTICSVSVVAYAQISPMLRVFILRNARRKRNGSIAMVANNNEGTNTEVDTGDGRKELQASLTALRRFLQRKGVGEMLEITSKIDTLSDLQLSDIDTLASSLENGSDLGEVDSDCFDRGGHKIFLKVAYFEDVDLSSEPELKGSDTRLRVLTILLAQEV